MVTAIDKLKKEKDQEISDLYRKLTDANFLLNQFNADKELLKLKVESLEGRFDYLVEAIEKAFLAIER